MSFKFIIKDSRYNNYKKIASSLFLLNAFLFISVALRIASLFSKIVLLSAALIIIVYAIYLWKYKKQKEKSFVFVYIFTAIIWITQTPSWYFALVLSVLLFIQLKLENDALIIISDDGILIQSLRQSRYEWTAFSNIVLKDGLLTLDYRNNKILQVEPDWLQTIMDKEYTELEKEFNDFCRQQLNK
jgi:hypothetical protein